MHVCLSTLRCKVVTPIALANRLYMEDKETDTYILGSKIKAKFKYFDVICQNVFYSDTFFKNTQTEMTKEVYRFWSKFNVMLKFCQHVVARR